MAKQGSNIYQRKDSRWEGRYIKGYSEGKIQYGYVFGRTYEDVKQKLEEAAKQSSDTFASVSREWLDNLKPQLKPSSIAKYTNILESYLVTEYGTRQVHTIRRSDIVNYSGTLLVSGGAKGTGLSPKTVNGIISVMKNVFEYAANEKNFVIADIKDVSVKQPQKPFRILSRSEQLKFSEYLRDHLNPCNLGILLCLYTGLRIGEICALTWKDVIWEEQCLYVHQTMQRVQKQEEGGKKTEVLMISPKSDCSIRKIPIPDEVFVLLKAAQKTADAFILTGVEDSYMEPRCMENHFKAAVRECNIRNVNFHALRHTFATRCVELGFDMKSLSEILGHASVNITLNRYVHPSMELKQKNMNMLSTLFAQK